MWEKRKSENSASICVCMCWELEAQLCKSESKTVDSFWNSTSQTFCLLPQWWDLSHFQNNGSLLSRTTALHHCWGSVHGSQWKCFQELCDWRHRSHSQELNKLGSWLSETMQWVCTYVGTFMSIHTLLPIIPSWISTEFYGSDTTDNLYGSWSPFHLVQNAVTSVLGKQSNNSSGVE